MPEPLGYFTFVLHSHLPYVIGHGRWPHGMDWLNEAAAESYIPLLKVFKKLANEGLTSGVTLGITPILAEMLAADTFAGNSAIIWRTRSRRPGKTWSPSRSWGTSISPS